MQCVLSVVYSLRKAAKATTHSTIITNPGINRIGALVLLLVVYTAGRSDGRHQAVASMANRPACHAELKP